MSTLTGDGKKDPNQHVVGQFGKFNKHISHGVEDCPEACDFRMEGKACSRVPMVHLDRVETRVPPVFPTFP